MTVKHELINALLEESDRRDNGVRVLMDTLTGHRPPIRFDITKLISLGLDTLTDSLWSADDDEQLINLYEEIAQITDEGCSYGETLERYGFIMDENIKTAMVEHIVRRLTLDRLIEEQSDFFDFYLKRGLENASVQVLRKVTVAYDKLGFKQP